MARKHLFMVALFTCSIIAISCGSNSNSSNNDQSNAPDTSASTTAPADAGAGSAASDSAGIGKFKNVQLTHPLDQKMIASGKSIYDLKCGSCHKLSDEKLVGPGWKGVTDRRTPEWIMNFVTNTDEMIDKNKTAQSLLEICMVRMPNQNLSDDDARSVLEFMRKNDGKK